jgi:C-terminal processing protease CtpA/Prc
MVRRASVLALFLMLGLCFSVSKPVQAATEDEYFELMKLFVDSFEQIDRNFVEKVDRRELVEAAMRGMIMKLDPYSSYIDTTELKQFNESVDQEFGGIGIQVTVEPKSRQLMVMTPLPGTPAYKAGIRDRWQADSRIRRRSRNGYRGQDDARQGRRRG